MKLYLGSGPGYPPHSQHATVMENPSEWTFVDLYVYEPHIKNWDCRKLSEVLDNSVEEIYSSHLLEHFPHTELKEILKTWFNKLKIGGKITLNVPDLLWASNFLIKHINGENSSLEYYRDFDGEHGILSIFYGSEVHDGEYHKSGFINSYLDKLLSDTGFKDIKLTNIVDAHAMGVIIAEATK